MKTITLLFLSTVAATIFLAHSETQVQQNYPADHSPGKIQNSSGGIPLNLLGVSAIKLKDGTRINNCSIKEVTPLFVFYIKNRTLHDIMTVSYTHLTLPTI